MSSTTGLRRLAMSALILLAATCIQATGLAREIDTDADLHVSRQLLLTDGSANDLEADPSDWPDASPLPVGKLVIFFGAMLLVAIAAVVIGRR